MYFLFIYFPVGSSIAEEHEEDAEEQDFEDLWWW